MNKREAAKRVGTEAGLLKWGRSDAGAALGGRAAGMHARSARRRKKPKR